MTAAVIWLALTELEAQYISLYDGSWMDYAARSGSPIAKTVA
jgi:3-mercaptopyruvate sulfurtransferase SseA